MHDTLPLLIELLESRTVALSSRFLRSSDFMFRLSPILPLNRAKDERQANWLRGFYLAETSEGVRGLIGAADPATMTRVQIASDNAIQSSRDWDQLLHGV